MAINGSSLDAGIVCYSPSMITTNGIWQGDDPLQYSLPLFILQLTLVVILTRILDFLLKPLGQPRVISEILGGIVLGPSVLGNIGNFSESVFPLRSIMVLETMANVGLLYFLFLVGVEMDLSMIRKTGKKALSIASAGILLPFLIAASASFIIENKARNDHPIPFLLFLSVALSATTFPVLARILAELKLLNTNLGRIAMSSAVITDMCAWSLLALAIAISETDKHNPLSALWVILSSITYVMFCFYVVRPGIEWIIHRTPEGENFNDFTICLILTGVMVSGFITDAIGTHSIFGAFLFGLVIPNGPLATTLVEKLEDFVAGLLLPLFFAVSGLRTDVRSLVSGKNSVFLLVVITLSSIAKMLGTYIVGFFFEMPSREGLSLGLLMSTKGLIEMIVLNVGRDQKVLDDDIFSVMVIVALVTTAIITPSVMVVYKPARRFIPYKRRTIQKKEVGEFRILTCLHTPRNVPTIINLLEASHSTKRSPITVYALHLVELTGRASAMLIVHSSRKDRRTSANRTRAQSEHIINAFENFEQHADFVHVHPLTAISPYSTMHEDICNLAEDRRAAFIIVPFHKQQTIDGGMEATNPVFRTINQNVLANAPCSVGILVDRGLGASTRHSTSQVAHHIAVLFFGGPDDRECLAYGWRISENPNVKITVVRFLPGEEAQEWSKHPVDESKEPATLSVITDNERERQLDEEYLKEFKTSMTASNDSVTYMEKITNNGEDTVSAIRSMDSIHDLYIVGRGQGIISPLTAGLTDWSECPELGAIGDLLASADFSATVSVLVVQQYAGVGMRGSSASSVATTPDSSNSQAQLQQNTQYNNIRNHRQPTAMPWQEEHH